MNVFCQRRAYKIKGRIGAFLFSLNLTIKDSVVVCCCDSVCVVISLVKSCCFNIVGDKLLLDFGVKLQNCHGNAPYVSEPNSRFHTY